MKCIHCSVRVDRTDWFCPNCKRSLRREPARNPARLWVPATAALLAATAAAGFGLSRMRGAVPADAAVSIREVPLVKVTTELPEPPKETVKEPSVRKRERVASTPERPRTRDDARKPEPEVASAEPERPVEGTGALNISTDRPVRTFVYLNGGTLLGEAPLRNAAIPAGKHTLVFWSPSVNGRSTRKVEVTPGGSVEVQEHVRSQDQFTEETGG